MHPKSRGWIILKSIKSQTKPSHFNHALWQCKTYRSALPGMDPIHPLAYTRCPKDYKKHQTQICTSTVKYLKLSGQKAMLLKLKNISKKHEYLLEGQGHRHRNCTCKILSLCMPADFWHLLLHRYFICSNHQQLLSFSIHTSSLMQKLCREQPQQHLSDLRLTQQLLDLIAAIMGNLQHWLTNMDHWALNIIKKIVVKTIIFRIFKKHSLFFTNDILLFYASLFCKAYKAMGRPSAWSTPFCH